jgi:hypothetical protein
MMVRISDANVFDLLVDLIARDLADVIIKDAVRRDPDRVIRVVIRVAADLKSQDDYGEEEIDLAVAQLCEELGLPPLRGSTEFWRSV